MKENNQDGRRDEKYLECDSNNLAFPGSKKSTKGYRLPTMTMCLPWTCASARLV